MNDFHNIDASYIRIWFDFFTQVGISQQVLESLLQEDRDELDEPEKQIPFHPFHAMMLKGAELIKPGVALNIGNQMAGKLKIIASHLCISSSTLEDVLHQFIRYSKIICEPYGWKMERMGRYTYLSLDFPTDKEFATHLVEGFLTSTTFIVQYLIDSEFNPKEIHFRFDSPEFIQEYKDSFQSKLKFNMAIDAILFNDEQLALGVSEDVPNFYESMESYQDDLLETINSESDFKDKIKRLILTDLSGGRVDIKSIAKKLNMEVVQMTDKLKDEGVSFHLLFKDIRKDLSLLYLKNEVTSLVDVAFLLGYSDLTSFKRAFKSWVGLTPFEYREEELIP